MGYLPQCGLGGSSVTAATAILGGLLAASSPASALEQLPQYPIGVGTVYDAFYSPVPGWTAYIYSLNFTDGFKDFKGDKFPPNSSLAANAIAFRPLYVWNAQFLGARPISWASVPVAYFDGTLNLQSVGGPLIHETDWMLGDASLAQGLSWHFGKNWSAQASLEVFFPTGPYSTAANHPFNLSSNVVSFYPNVSATYWNHDSNDTLTLKFQYITSTENTARHYQNGDSVTVEGAAGLGLERFGLNRNLGLDLVGFALTQIEDDSGTDVPAGRRSELYGLGPQLRYNFERGGLAVKWEHEFDGKGVCQGERLWAQTAFPLFSAAKPMEAPLK
jgi:hypothetical protein